MQKKIGYFKYFVLDLDLDLLFQAHYLEVKL